VDERIESNSAASSERHPNARAFSSLPSELRRTTVPAAVRSWVTANTGATVRRVTRLPGASSTAVHALYLSNGVRLVLRRYVWPGFLLDEPIAPRRELDALEHASTAGLPVPEVVAADTTGEEVGDRIPALLMTFLGGRALGYADPAKLAGIAAQIHGVDAGEFGHVYYPWYESTSTAAPTGCRRPEMWERAIALWHTAMPPYRATFIHRDFHPGNVLWSRGRASGIVDWANACRGPCGCDLAHCRANLLELSGADAADRFLAAYESLTGESCDPYWEMASILEHGPSHWTSENLASAEPRLERLVETLSESTRASWSGRDVPRPPRRPSRSTSAPDPHPTGAVGRLVPERLFVLNHATEPVVPGARPRRLTRDECPLSSWTSARVRERQSDPGDPCR